MGLYVDATKYNTRFGASTAPTDIDYKELISVELFKLEMPQPILIPSIFTAKGTYYKAQFEAGLLEQIKYFTDNPNLFDQLTTDSGEFSILGYTEKRKEFDSKEQGKRIAPNAYLYLNSINLTSMKVAYYG